MTLHFLFTPVIPLKSDLAVELQEKGRVRFWLQAAQMSANGKVDYVFNDNVISQGDVSEMFNSFFHEKLPFVIGRGKKHCFLKTNFSTEIQNEL